MVTTSCTAGRAGPGELLSGVMDGLAGCGLEVARGEDGLLAIAWPGARCALAVSDCGRAEWEYCPLSPGAADPGLVADLATVLLTGQAGPFPRLGDGSGSVTFKGVVARELVARGLEVELAVYADRAVFDAFAEIVATAPGDDGGQVHVSDDGGLTWIGQPRGDASGASGPRGQAGGPLAAGVVEAISRAMDCLRASGQARRHEHRVAPLTVKEQ
jgi:hypothetical protein